VPGPNASEPELRHLTSTITRKAASIGVNRQPRQGKESMHAAGGVFLARRVPTAASREALRVLFRGFGTPAERGIVTGSCRVDPGDIASFCRSYRLQIQVKVHVRLCLLTTCFTDG